MRFLHRKEADESEEDLLGDHEGVVGVDDPPNGGSRSIVGRHEAVGDHAVPIDHTVVTRQDEQKHDDRQGDDRQGDDRRRDEFDDGEFDGDDEAGTRIGLRWLIVTAVVVALALGAFLARGPIGDALRPDRSTGTRSTATSVVPAGVQPTAAVGATTAATASTAASAASDAAPSTASASAAVGAAAPSTTGTAGAASTAGAATVEVTTIQVVPAMRNVIVVANGTTYASASDGTIALAANDRHGDVQIVGLTAQPALEQLTFTGWGDGDVRTTRPLDSVNGPIAQVGFDVTDRVQAVAGGIEAGGAAIAFSSNAGPLILTVGQTAWVVENRAVAGPTGLVEQPVVYTAESLTRGTTSVPLSRLTYTPTPEAIWTIVA